MYDRDDVQVLTERFMECIDQRKNKKENNFNGMQAASTNKMNNRKLSRDEEMRKRKMAKTE